MDSVIHWCSTSHSSSSCSLFLRLEGRIFLPVFSSRIIIIPGALQTENRYYWCQEKYCKSEVFLQISDCGSKISMGLPHSVASDVKINALNNTHYSRSGGSSWPISLLAFPEKEHWEGASLSLCRRWQNGNPWCVQCVVDSMYRLWLQLSFFLVFCKYVFWLSETWFRLFFSAEWICMWGWKECNLCQSFQGQDGFSRGQ